MKVDYWLVQVDEPAGASEKNILKKGLVSYDYGGFFFEAKRAVQL